MSSTDSLNTPDPNQADTFVPSQANPQEAQPVNGSEKESLFSPVAPENLEDTGLDETVIFRLVLKYLYIRGTNTGREIADQIKLPFNIVEPLLFSLRNQQLIGYKGSSLGSDYQYELSPKGIEQARQHMAQCTYCGSAPVSLKEYQRSVSKQSLKNLSPQFSDVQRSLSDLVIEPVLISQVGQALSGNSCLFLYGAPGNGKSSIAQRVVSAVDPYVWVPRTIVIGGEIIRFFDASVHTEAPLPESEGLLEERNFDKRWVRIQRPTIVVGGELSLSHMEATLNPVTGIIEAPIHMKSNTGCLVVDDFGRQRIKPIELLNRWIVPLEANYDYLCLPSGRQIQVPFDQLLVFATNLTPKSIVDEAFLRRIPYKVQVFDPTETQFRTLFKQRCNALGIEFDMKWVEYLLDKQYRQKQRSLRFCHVDDLLKQIRDFCEFHGQPPVVNQQTLDMATHNYFSQL